MHEEIPDEQKVIMSVQVKIYSIMVLCNVVLDPHFHKTLRAPNFSNRAVTESYLTPGPFLVWQAVCEGAGPSTELGPFNILTFSKKATAGNPQAYFN